MEKALGSLEEARSTCSRPCKASLNLRHFMQHFLPFTIPTALGYALPSTWSLQHFPPCPRFPHTLSLLLTQHTPLLCLAFKDFQSFGAWVREHFIAGLNGTDPNLVVFQMATLNSDCSENGGHFQDHPTLPSNEAVCSASLTQCVQSFLKKCTDHVRIAEQIAPSLGYMAASWNELPFQCCHNSVHLLWSHWDGAKWSSSKPTWYASLIQALELLKSIRPGVGSRPKNCGDMARGKWEEIAGGHCSIPVGQS